MSDVIEFSAGDFVHLGLGATVAPLPRHTGDVSWYEQYGRAHGADGNEGRLVSLHTPSDPPTVLFITAGVGTQMRDR